MSRDLKSGSGSNADSKEVGREINNRTIDLQNSKEHKIHKKRFYQTTRIIPGPVNIESIIYSICQ